MSGSAVNRRRPSGLSVAVFVLALLTTLATFLVVRLWLPIDSMLAARADGAASDTGLLAPGQDGLWLAAYAAAGFSLVTTVLAGIAMVDSRPPAVPASKDPPGRSGAVDTKI